MAKWKPHGIDFKRRAVERMKSCDDVSALARELQLPRSLLYTWKRQLEGRPGPHRADLSQTGASSVERKLREENRLLKEVLGEKTLEADFFAGALRGIEERRQKNIEPGGTASTPKSGRGPSARQAD